MNRDNSNTPPVVMLYVTAGSPEEAGRIGRTLVEERLVACVNVIPSMHAIYRWQGRIEEAQECVILAKTRRERVASCIARIRALHSYECPCVVALPIAEGNPAFLDWITEQTGPSSPPCSGDAGLW